MVILHVTPNSACEVFIVSLTLAVFVLEALFGTLICYAVTFNYMLCSVSFIGINENIKKYIFERKK